MSLAPGSRLGAYYSVSPDGQRFLVRRAPEAQNQPATSVFINWTSAIAGP